MTIALTIGEPAGIGPELCARVACGELPAPVVAIGDRDLLERRAALIGITLSTVDAGQQHSQHTPGRLPVVHIPLPVPDRLGEPQTAHAGALLEGLDRAIDGCLNGNFAAMVTAPLQKSVINDAGFAFSGHTEYVAARCKAQKPVMLLANDQLRVALATTHLPLRQVADAITAELLDQVLDVLWHDLKHRFALANPNIAVCGLNPHAGEGGHLGAEDQAVIAPAIERQRARGRHVHGPWPADTIFNHAGANADAILAMFHDQGLPVIKYAGFGNIVNLTLGLPIIRTSVDHGSALDIAGSGKASADSLLAAIAMAARLSANSAI